MKKRVRKNVKLQLNRDTVKKLNGEDMAKVEGGLINGNAFNCTGCDSGCGIFE